MGMMQRIVAFAVFIVRSLSAWVRSLLPSGAAPPAGASLAPARAEAGQERAPIVSPASPAAAEEELGQHIHLPRPTIWPAMIAFGTTLLGFGVMSSLTFAICGVVILLLGVAGWIQELRHA